MRKHLLSLFAIVTSVAFSSPVFAYSADVEAAIELTQHSHTDLCLKKHLKVQLLIAHQHHDQATLASLGQDLDAINKHLKPVETKLNALKLKMKKSPDDESDFEMALLQFGNCE